jgi:hypothetical protein
MLARPRLFLQAYSAIGKVLQRRFLAMSVESIVNTTSKLTKGQKTHTPYVVALKRKILRKYVWSGVEFSAGI